MKPKSIRMIALVLCVVLAITFVFSTLFSIFSISAQAVSTSGLEEQLDQLDEEKKQLEEEIKSISSDLSSAYKRKDNLERQINVTVEEINKITTLIDMLTAQIEQKKQELLIAEDTLQQQYELFKTRMRVMYENGDTTYLDLLLTSGNFTELLTRVEVVNQIMEYDKKLVTVYTKAKEEVEAAKLSLEEDCSEQEALKTASENKKNSLTSKRSEVAGLVKTLISDKTQTKAELEKTEKEYEAVGEELRRIAAEAARKANGVITGDLLWPTPSCTWITSPFGYRIHPKLGYKKFHNGIDIGAASGAKILAVDSGTVLTSRYNSSYGNYVMIDHENGMVTLYAHMLERMVVVGQKISAGTQIGKVGTTGTSTGNHLHFSVIINGEYKNAMDYYN